MTVGELIEKLSAFPPGLRVVGPHDHDWYTVVDASPPQLFRVVLSEADEHKVEGEPFAGKTGPLTDVVYVC